MNRITALLLIVLALTGKTQEIYHTGNEVPVDTDHLPGLVLAGGQTDNDDAMTWMLERADGGDVVVLRASGSDGYNNYFYSSLGVEVNSVISIVITGPEDADSQEVIDILEHAEVVFIAGGNQWNYVDEWRDSQMLAKLNQLISDKQITIGGTSAGMAVLGEVIFTAEEGTVWSSEALGNPYHWRMKLEKDFLDVPFMEQTVTDSHYNRVHDDGMDRRGRHVGFMARMIADWEMDAKGIAANEYTAIAVDETGNARVFGHPGYDDYGFFLKKHGGPPEVCEQGEALHWEQDEEAIRVYKVKGDYDGSGWFNLDTWEEGEGGEWQFWYVADGELRVAGEDDDTSVAEPPQQPLTMKVYPNPAEDRLTVKLFHQAKPGFQGRITLEILTLAGQQIIAHDVESLDANMYTLDVSALPGGAYILRASDGRQSVSKSWMRK